MLGMNNFRGDILAAASVGLLGWALFALFYVDIPDGNKDVLLVVIGVLTTIVKDVFSFEFGASKSGERSAKVVVETMKDAAATATQTAVNLAVEAKAALGTIVPTTAIKADDVKVEASGDVTVEKKP